jgi:hypothetical protein
VRPPKGGTVRRVAPAVRDPRDSSSHSSRTAGQANFPTNGCQTPSCPSRVPQAQIDRPAAAHVRTRRPEVRDNLLGSPCLFQGVGEDGEAVRV